ncbi:DUF4345 domain-containing protein [Rhizosaccharibacter radicis]|uniref:DUF4345 domain-containing protein n=1 Tax=Rhizosaccharibacter radicis TaxID=2782605 RepID=A0ABT1VWY0_9PROT|nr:DUF4345 domain-containing protein [Acetobacteraceae bacterium KSS12]
MTRAPRGEALVLRAAVAVLALVPIGAGIDGMVLGAAMSGRDAVAPGPDALALDSHVRYLSGLLLAIGLGFWSTIPKLERQGARFTLLTLLVVVGGLGRLGGVALAGPPPGPMLFGLVMELGVTPALWLWRRRVARDVGTP